MSGFNKISSAAAILIAAQMVAAQTSVWDGTANTAWFTSNPSAKVFTIRTAEQLAGLAELVNEGNDFEGKTIKLGANIILNDTADWQNWARSAPANEWIAIGHYDHNYECCIYAEQFSGTFDGCGFVVRGVYINSSNNISQGLFGIVSYGDSGFPIIKNLGIVASYIKGGSIAGGLAGYNGGIIINCYFKGKIYGRWRAGGLVGYNDGHIYKDCYAIGEVSSGNHSGVLVGNELEQSPYGQWLRIEDMGK